MTGKVRLPPQNESPEPYRLRLRVVGPDATELAQPNFTCARPGVLRTPQRGYRAPTTPATLRFGADMPHLPGRPGLLHGGQHPVGGLRDPVRVGDRRGLGGGASTVRTIEATATGLPNTAEASLSQVARCSFRIGVRVWGRGSPTLPAGPAVALRPVWVVDHDRSGTGRQAGRGGG
jgi:hypothetical protein